ncbi:CD9 antigen-like isoform X1 [Vespa mandarinia]|uniref:CD9 antigen-like isoform X1 n=2 Tax=Vespa mandarinia TaxID=7446 RepID=UPI0016210FC3|nr:CD9 antigen-like isoform X1 [Vespa mandarinia]
MVLPKCYGFIKYALVWVNLVFWAVGLAAVVLAIWMLTDQTFLVSLAQEQHNFNAGLYILLAAGLVMLVVAFLGCCGAFRESQCMLVGFFSCLLVVIVAQIAAGVWLYTNSERLEELVKSSVINTVKKEYGSVDVRTQTVDAFQSGLGCCGATGPADWAGSVYANFDSSIPLSLTVSSKSNNAYKVPKSCCKDKDSVACELARNLKIADIVSPAIYNEGCIDKLVEALKSQSCIVIGVAIAVGILELLGLIFALILCCASGTSDRYKA